jgi:hypothetical protein
MPPARVWVAASCFIPVIGRYGVVGTNRKGTGVCASPTICFSACRSGDRLAPVSIQGKTANAPTWWQGKEILVSPWGAVNTIAITWPASHDQPRYVTFLPVGHRFGSALGSMTMRTLNTARSWKNRGCHSTLVLLHHSTFLTVGQPRRVLLPGPLYWARTGVLRSFLRAHRGRNSLIQADMRTAFGLCEAPPDNCWQALRKDRLTVWPRTVHAGLEGDHAAGLTGWGFCYIVTPG